MLCVYKIGIYIFHFLFSLLGKYKSLHLYKTLIITIDLIVIPINTKHISLILGDLSCLSL